MFKMQSAFFQGMLKKGPENPPGHLFSYLVTSRRVVNGWWSTPGVRRSILPKATGAMAMLQSRKRESATHKEASSKLNTLCISLKIISGKGKQARLKTLHGVGHNHPED